MTQFIVLVAIVIVGFISMLLIAPYDLGLTIYLSEHKLSWFVDLMSESIFELEMVGGGDIVAVYAAICLLLYLSSSLIDVECSSNRFLFPLQNRLVSKSGWADWLRRHRFRLEFLVVSTFFCSTLMVKLLKWTMARPRPKKIFWGTRPFSEWYEVGPYFLDEGTYRASFSSGHTASAICLMGLVYVFFSFSGKQYRRSGILLTVAVLIFASAMALARVMTRAHWPTDVLFSIFGGLVLIHVLFFYGLRMTTGMTSYSEPSAEYCPPAPFRGLLICWYATLFCLALVGIFLGLKHFIHDRWPWLMVISICSVPLLIYSAKKIFESGLFKRYD